VLEDVTLHVKQGERLALVGEAGSGKTALARCLSGLGTFADGEARLDGTLLPGAPMERAAALAQAVRLVPGDMARAFDPRHPLIDALAQAPMARGQSMAQARAAALEMMDLTGLPRSFAQARPVELPPPAARRAGLARALLAAPHVVLLEDWFGGCDALAQAGLARLVEDMQERFSVGVILVTHDLRDAARLCHRTAIMARGRIVEDGPTGDLLDNPRHPYTQALLAALPRAPRP
jgi:peptide/nickel transport system ATP-binding protein